MKGRMRGFSGVLRKLKRRADRADRRAGVSMAIVICIGTLLIAFSLAMAYTGSLMMATANTRLEEERAYQLAKSFSEELGRQLCDECGDGKAGQGSDFYKFARDFIGYTIYSNYDSDHRDTTVYKFHLPSESESESESEKALPDDYGDITVRMYKVSTEATANSGTLEATTGTTNYYTGQLYVEALKAAESFEYNLYDLVIEVVATYGDSEYIYKTQYICKETFRLNLTIQDDDGTVQQQLYYNSSADTAEASYYIYTDQANSKLYAENGTITYTHLTDNSNVITRKFYRDAEEK